MTKPSSEGGAEAALQCVRDELVERIRTFCRAVRREDEASSAADVVAPPPASRRPGPVEALAIGVSTGGPNALAALLPCLPADLSIPVLIVQHMPALFTEMLASRLAQRSVLPIGEGVSGRRVEPGHVYLAPGDYHMLVERRGATIVLRTNQDGPENFCRPSVDVLFRSVADVYGDGALSVVMTGMGQDGLEGCRRIREAGGSILVQDEATSVVWGMPGYVARAGLADAILPLDRLGIEIGRRLKRTGAVDETGSGPRASVSPSAAATRWP